MNSKAREKSDLSFIGSMCSSFAGKFVIMQAVDRGKFINRY
jgi:hypothetical protein